VVAGKGYRIVKENSSAEKCSTLWNILELVGNGDFDGNKFTYWKMDRISV
jgi:hypothetical protein